MRWMADVGPVAAHTLPTTIHPTPQCSAVQCSAVQCSAVQCSAVQCSAVQCSAHTLPTTMHRYSLVHGQIVWYQCQESAVQCSAVQCQESASRPDTNLSASVVRPFMAERLLPIQGVFQLESKLEAFKRQKTSASHA
jgi:hypothetical protein